MRKHVMSYIALLFLLVCLVGCQPLIVDARTSVQPTAQIALHPASTTKLPTAAIFSQISPAVAFVETPTGTGSGVLIEHGYLLSNAHVVWPFDKVRVVFPDKTEFTEAPVVAWDLMADLALIGPLDVKLPPVPLVDGSSLAIGSDIYLLGYPAEVEEFPQPTITTGILSRVRQWDAINYRFFQVDATTVGGQSGGIMVTQTGDVVGVSTFYYRGFGLAGSVADTLTRINAMLGNATDVTLDQRQFNTGKSATNHTDTLRGDWDSRLYILNEPIDTSVELSIEGFGRPQLAVHSLSGYFIDASELTDDTPVTTLNFTIEEAGLYVIQVWQPSQNENSFVLKSSHPLAPYIDPDDNRSVAIGDTVAASMDTSSDVDYYELTLKKDEIVQITIDALEVDPELALAYKSPMLEEVVTDNDSGGGIFGSNAQLTYQAPADDTYRLLVRNYDYGSVGSYFLRVVKAEADAELTEPTVTRELFPSGFGPMTWYKSEEANFAVLYPTLWTEVTADRCAPGATACYTGPGVILITEESLAALPKKERNREGYLAMIYDTLKMSPGVELEGVKEVRTLQKLTAHQLSFTTQAGRATGRWLVYVDQEQKIAFGVAVILPTEAFAFYEPMTTLLFDSFRNWDVTNAVTDAVYQLDKAHRLTLAKDFAGARHAYDRSIALHPNFIQAYAGRAWINYQVDEHEKAIADIERAIRLDPNDERYYGESAMLYWYLHQDEEALQAIDAALERAPEQSYHYNQRALIKTFLGDYEGALADLAEYETRNNDELPPSALDTRAFVYLMMEDFIKAKADYKEAYSQDFRSPYTLLGGGIVYAALGEEDEAQALIEEGFKKLVEQEVELPDPQLSTLVERAQAILDKQ